MKSLLLLLLAVLLGSAVRAQETRPQQFQYRPGIGLEEFKDGTWKKILTDSAANRNGYAALLHKKPGVYSLPQDNMPCIVPDTSKTVKIPNAWKGRLRIPYKSNPPRIPNLTKPWVPTPITSINADANTK